MAKVISIGNQSFESMRERKNIIHKRMVGK